MLSRPWFGAGPRIDSVRSALWHSGPEAARMLAERLVGIDLSAVAGVLLSACQDIALLWGGAAVLGGAAGGLVGAFGGGIGAGPDGPGLVAGRLGARAARGAATLLPGHRDGLGPEFHSGAFHRLPSAQLFADTGLGLATVRRIIVCHGGRIWAESRPGGSTTFFFTLQDLQPASQAGDPALEQPLIDHA